MQTAEATPTTFTKPTSALRALAIDAVERAKSGHPGAPMGMAEIADALWTRHLKHNPANPTWPDRDRFVLSNGHASMLLYALLHLSGYDLTIDDLKNFRQLGSRTAGHPEFGHTPGVETTTGPLGQGFANAVGMALAEKILAARFNRDGHAIVDHMTYVFCGDGCLMEGVSHEAASLAGVLKLGKLVVLYDDNGISIDGQVAPWFADDTAKRFEAYGWHVVCDVDGHDTDAVDAAIAAARAVETRPSLVVCKTVIGQGSPARAGTHDVHGAPLGAAEAAATKLRLDWPHAPFDVPATAYAHWNARERGAAADAAWQARFAAYRAAFPELAAEFERTVRSELPRDWPRASQGALEQIAVKTDAIATRKASQLALESFGPLLPELFGGSADLTHSNLTAWKGSRQVTDDAAGNYYSFGVREFGMMAAANGIALHGGLIPYTGTFAVFSDYARSAIRMAALMRARQVFVLTHDSIGLGEDGPTHQPIEHAASLRLIPNLDVWRPCDATETFVAWRAGIERNDGPTALLLSRQNLLAQSRDAATLAAVARGGYVLAECDGAADVVLIATGSEVSLAVAAKAQLATEGVAARVVSMPCTSVFDRQEAAWRDAVLPRGVPRVAVEAGVSDYWRKYVGLEGAVLGIDRFGESGKAEALFAHFGFTAERVAELARGVIALRSTECSGRAVHRA